MLTLRAARRSAVELLLLVCLTLSAGSTAWSFWSAASVAGGYGASGAASVNQAATPIATVAGPSSVKISWGTSTLSNGRALSGYRITRYDATSGAAQTVAAGCAGTVATLTCTENAVPAGQWKYAVTPLVGANWTGPGSLRSGAVTIGSGSLTLVKTIFGASPALPQNTTGTLAGFHPAETVTYKIDATATAGTTSAVAGDGSATISALTIANLPDGPHTVYATGTATTTSSVASTGIIIDTIAPTVTTQLTPAANASGWNNTAPVSVALDPADGTGSGISATRYTVDGTDPTSSGSALTYSTPLSISVNTQVRYYATDQAGNASAVAAQLIRIDTGAPASSIALSGVTGGAYLSAGKVYFRGVAPGSFTLANTVTDSGGSGAASSTTTALAGSAAGWTHTPSLVATPAGGPYASNAFSWSAGTTDAPSETITARDVAGNPTSTALAFTADSAPPAGGSVDATGLGGTAGRYSRSLTLAVAFTKGTDFGAGLRPTGARLLRASATLSSADGTTDGSCGSYGAFVQLGADDPASPAADTVPADNRCYRYEYLVADNVGNQAVLTSNDIKVQTGVPASLTPTGVTISPVTGGGAQSVTGSSLYYNPAQSGSFSVDAAASDATSGVANVAFPALAGFTGGGAATFPLTATTYRTTYSWSANGAFASPGSQSLPATDNAGAVVTAANAFAVVKDTTGPTGGSVDAVGLSGTSSRYSVSATLNVGFAAGSDAGAGVAAGGATLSRATATLTSSNGVVNGACGAYGASTQIASGPVAPVSDTVAATAACYRYTYVVLDRVGNTTTYTSPDVKVDPTPSSAPALAFSSLTNSFVTGTTVYYRPGATSGAFTVTGTATDTGSGLASFTFPTLGTGWTATAGALGVATYSWAAADPAVPSGGQNVSAVNNAGLVSAATAFTPTPDGTAPVGGSESYTDGFTKSTSAVVSFTQGSDAASGLEAASGLLQRASATLTGSTCGAFGAFATVATNPISPATNTGLISGTCYQYRYAVSDRVGNQALFTSPNVVKIDTVAPTHVFTLSAPVSAFVTSTKLYYRSTVAGSFRLVDALTDGLSGPASVTFPAVTTAGWTHAAETFSTPAGGPFTSSTFSWTANPSGPGTVTVTGLDNVTNSGSGALAFTSDISAPSAGSITYPNTLTGVASVPVSLTNGTDSGSGLNLASALVQRDEAPLTTSTEICGAFAGTFATPVTLVGGADTSVATGRCYKYRYSISDNVGNVRLVTSTNVTRVDVGGVFISAIASQQSAGTAGNGLLEVGDKLVLTWSENLATSSVPTTLTGATLARSTSAAARITLPGISNGSQSTGSALYFSGTTGTGTATFNAAVALVNSGAATTMTVTVTSLAVTAGTLAASAGTLAFQPPTTITNLAGTRTAAGTFSTVSTFKLF